MAAGAALDLAARERVAAVLRAHALVLAAVPVVMVVWFCLRGVGASAFSLLGVRGTTMFGFVVQLGVCSLLGETLRRGIAASAQTKSYVLI